MSAEPELLPDPGSLKRGRFTYFPVIPLFSNRWASTRGADVHGDFFDPVYMAPTYADLWLG